MKQEYTILVCLVMCFFGAMDLTADTLQGRVVDADTSEPLQGAKIVFEEEAIGQGGTNINVVYADSLGRFQYTCRMEMSKLTITASHFGYHSQSVQRSGNNDRDTIAIADFRLKMDEHLLGEVTVEGRVRRFYMRGDTIVFNPSAFRTQDGAQLLELIEQLPGVSIEDGKLLWNGEPLKLMMNGQEVFSEAMLANLLPVETVKDIKAYDKQSELAERTGVADGQEEHVLDVTIKPGFMDKMYGDTELKGLTSKHYAAHLRAMRMSDTDPLMLFARAADDPKVISIATLQRNGSWQGDTPVRQQTGALGYGHFWKPAYKVHRISNWNITGGVNHTDSSHDSWENRQSFIPGHAATETDQTARDDQHALKIPVDFSSFVNLSPNYMLAVTVNMTYQDERKREENKGQTYNLETPELLTNASDYSALHHKEGLSSNFKTELFRLVGKSDYAASVAISYQNMKSEGSSTGIYQYMQSETSQTDQQTYQAPLHDLTAELRLRVRRPWGQQAMVSAEWKSIYMHNYRDEQRYRSNVLDLANSLLCKNNTWQNRFNLGTNITSGHLSVNPVLDFTHWHERSDYRRGSLDTLATRSLLLCKPSLELTYKLQKQTRLRGKLVYESQRPDLIDCIGYRDDTNPLYIVEGNPQLTPSHTLFANLTFSTMLTRANQVLNISVDYRKDVDPIGTSYYYNSQTGAYRVQKQNVRGGERWGAALTYERTLGAKFHLRNHLSENYGQTYGIMTLVDDATGIVYNRQRNSDFAHNLKLEFTNGPLLLRLNHDFSWHYYAYSDAAQPRQDIYNYRAELTAQYQWKSWTFSLFPSFLLDRGYMADLMNTNRFLLNASVDYKFFKNKAGIRLYVNDPFNSDTRYRSSVTATTRVESGSSFLHHYVSLTFNYKFDAK